jgi:hypothetical protein
MGGVAREIEAIGFSHIFAPDEAPEVPLRSVQ